MIQKNDQIFQLSLTEIAFTISFILLLLLGYLVGKEQSDRKIAEEALSEIQTLEQQTSALNLAKSELTTLLRNAGSPNPDGVIKKLIAADEVRAERDFLKKQVEDLDSKLTALTELRNQLEDAGKESKKKIILEEVESAISFLEQVKKLSPDKVNDLENTEIIEKIKQAITATDELKKQLKTQINQELKPGQEAQAVQDIVTAAKNYNELVKLGSSPELAKKENSDLRGQIAFLKNKLARGGLDYPPCWADEKTGKVEFLFSIEVKPNSVVLEPAWPQSRENDASSLPGIADVLSGNPHSNEQFISSIQAIFNKSQQLQCRYYVQLKSTISDAVQSDRSRLMVERYFYKFEVRR